MTRNERVLKNQLDRIEIDAVMLLWFSEQLRKRQDNSPVNDSPIKGDEDLITQIEKSYCEMSKRYDVPIDFRFDRPLSLVSLISSLVVGSYEHLVRFEQHKNELWKGVAEKFGDYDKQVEKFNIDIKSIRGTKGVDLVPLRLRNCFSHYRYSLLPDERSFRFEDLNPKAGLKTSDFTMSAMNLADFSYQFAIAFLKAAGELGLRPR